MYSDKLFKEIIEGDVVQVESFAQLFVISRLVTGSQQILEVGGEDKDQIDEKIKCKNSISDKDTEGVTFESFEVSKQVIEDMARNLVVNITL